MADYIITYETGAWDGADYGEWIADRYQESHGESPPVKPEEAEMDTVGAFVNSGRWLWQCEACDSAYPISKADLTAICIQCGGAWMRVILPDEIDDIEVELLKQPGYRSNAPIRNWLPGWSLETLEKRTEKAKAKQTDTGSSYIRNLSIGTPRVWAVGETLTAANMNTYISEILKDLIGTNGNVELVDDLEFESGHGVSHAFVLGLGDTLQSILNAKATKADWPGARHISTAAPATADGSNGDLWFRRQA